MAEGLFAQEKVILIEVDKELTFEQSVNELEQIVKDLEQKDVPLEEALQMFSKGVELVRYCNSLLDTAEKQIEILLEGPDGKLKTAPMSLGVEA